MTFFLLSLLSLSAAAVFVTVRAIGQARDGFEDAAGFHGEVPVPVGQAQESQVRPAICVRAVSLAS
jgi:hypothetical protein